MSLTPIAPETASPSPTTLILKEKAAWKSLSNDSGKIKDTDGNLVFDIDAALMTMSERRTLKDAAGKEVGQVRRKKTPGLHPAMYVGTMEEEKKCMVKTKGMLNPMKCDADIYVGDAVVGQASGNWRAKSYSFTLDGKEVATVKRKTGLTGMILEKDSYCIDIAAGVDRAFICLVVIAVDELYHDEK
mmetsp:Transcript_23971/g.49508  ORF Transcript_23971/g.49508 Transcript_23971/m.49508 type:complete len:187 (-) Transcript_23971:121-681(-)